MRRMLMMKTGVGRKPRIVQMMKLTIPVWRVLLVGHSQPILILRAGIPDIPNSRYIGIAAHIHRSRMGESPTGRGPTHREQLHRLIVRIGNQLEGIVAASKCANGSKLRM